MNSRILVSGVSGPIGAALLPSLRAGGCAVVRLVSEAATGGAQNDTQIPWDPAQPISPETDSGIDAAIHLAGDSIIGRWTAVNKEKIRESRIAGSSNLAETLAHAILKPRVFINSSA